MRKASERLDDLLAELCETLERGDAGVRRAAVTVLGDLDGLSGELGAEANYLEFSDDDDDDSC